MTDVDVQSIEKGERLKFVPRPISEALFSIRLHEVAFSVSSIDFH